VVSPSLLVSARLMVEIFGTFCDGFMVQCVKLMLSKFLHLQILLFERYICCQNVTCLKRFTRYGHYTGERDIVIAGLTNKLFLKSLSQKLEQLASV